MLTQYPSMINLFPIQKNLQYNNNTNNIALSQLAFVFPQKIAQQNNINEQKNKTQYFCKDKCNVSFKSLQKKIAHHNRLDEFCTDEKTKLYMLLNEFKSACDILIKSENIKDYKGIKHLNDQYKKAKSSSVDKNLWSNFLA